MIQCERIWLTTATEEGKSLRVLCLDRNTGKLLNDIVVFRLKSAATTHAKNLFASPTPVPEGDNVLCAFRHAWFGVPDASKRDRVEDEIGLRQRSVGLRSVTGDFNVNVMWVIEAAKRSAASGKPVSLLLE